MSNKRKATASLAKAGFKPDSAAAAVEADDLSLLEHSGRLRVKLPAPKPEPDRVTAGYIFEDEIKASFFHSFIRLLGFDAENEGRIWSGGFIPRRGTTGDLAGGRNEVVMDFLKTESQWLWWVDTDMGFEPDVVERLLEAADPVERPVVGGLCFAQREHISDGVGGWRPTAWPVVMDWNVVDGRGGFEVRWDYPRDTLTRCSATGSACILIHRSVFERMQSEYSEQVRQVNVARQLPEELGLPWNSWYSRVSNPTTGELMGEDLSFCARLLRLEIPVHVHTGVQTTHQKHIWLQEADYWGQRALSPSPETVEAIAREDWVAPRFVVVPTHNRPERLKALVASAGQQCDTIVVLDNASQPPVDWAVLAAVAPKATVEVLRDEEQPPNLSRFWNVLFDRCAKLATDRGEDRWDVAVFNDDAVLPSGWFDACQTVLRGHETAVAAHTGSVPVHRHELLEEYPYPREKRMCPWAFVVKGEAGLRADETFAWFYGDDDFTRALIDAGGVMAVPGPIVINAHAVQATQQNPVLAELAAKDKVAFEAKWAGRL
jgi:GT2 family glycosyltransferase